MTTEYIGYVRGFDLYFFGTSEKILQSIAEDLGGNSSYRFDEECVTYMCEQTHAINSPSQLNHIHNVVRSVGNYFALNQCCPYLYGELYMSTNENGFALFKTRFS